MTNEELIDRQMCQMCNRRIECIKDKRYRCVDYEDAVELLKEKDRQFKEEFGLLIEWFDHIAQIADDRKTLNGYVMQDSDALDEIKCLAKRCSEYISML